MNQFDPANLKQIRADLTAAIASVEKIHGIKIKLGTFRYTSSEFSFKATSVLDNGDTPVDNPKWKSDFMKNHFVLNLKKESFGEKIIIQGKEFIIVGAQPRKANVIVKDKFNKFFSYPTYAYSSEPNNKHLFLL